MHVASLELSHTLYELSGWQANYAWYKYEVGRSPKLELAYDMHKPGDDYMIMYAYDLDYLLQKLPQIFRLTHRYDRWYAQYRKQGSTFAETEADTPEDAAVLLAIKLFKEGKFKKEGK